MRQVCTATASHIAWRRLWAATFIILVRWWWWWWWHGHVLRWHLCWVGATEASPVGKKMSRYIFTYTNKWITDTLTHFQFCMHCCYQILHEKWMHHSYFHSIQQSSCLDLSMDTHRLPIFYFFLNLNLVETVEKTFGCNTIHKTNITMYNQIHTALTFSSENYNPFQF